MKFADLNLSQPLLRAVEAEGYQEPTRIQAAAIPAILAGRDVLGCAQTGTGKTAAFALPTLERLISNVRPNVDRRRPIRALVLAPTRELALQICESFQTYGKRASCRHAVIFGGVSQNNQVRALKHGVDVLVATPGRLLDLMNQGFVDLSHVEILILDEADRMLDMGFIHDLRRIVAKCPAKRQTLLFSATMPDEIRDLARQWQSNPERIEVTPVSSTAARIDQSVFFVEKGRKIHLLMHWLEETVWQRVLVFTRTKHGADKVVRHLVKNRIPADALHGNKSQSARQRALARFQLPKPLVLVATDIAARGLDVDQISHVINFDIPHEPESYVHRIGRTGRAAASGTAISFCDREERRMLKAIEQLTRRNLQVQDVPESIQTKSLAAVPPTDRPHADRPRKERAFEKASAPMGAPGARPKKKKKRRPTGNANEARPQSPTGKKPFGKKPFGKKKRRNSPGKAFARA